MSAASVDTTDTGPNVWERRLLLSATVIAVTAVAGIAGAISYGHMHDWAAANGEPSWRALLFPLSVDGLLIAASVVLLADSRSGRKGDWLAYLLASVGAAVSVAANVAHDWTDPIAATAIAGWPPVALLGSYELLIRLLRRLRMPITPSVATATAVGETMPMTAPAAESGRPTRTPPAVRPVKRGSTRPHRTTAVRSQGRGKAEAWWVSERALGRLPSGAEVARVAGVDASLGRRWRREWMRDETDNKTDEISDKTNHETNAAGTTGESRTATESEEAA